MGLDGREFKPLFNREMKETDGLYDEDIHAWWGICVNVGLACKKVINLRIQYDKSLHQRK